MCVYGWGVSHDYWSGRPGLAWLGHSPILGSGPPADWPSSAHLQGLGSNPQAAGDGAKLPGAARQGGDWGLCLFQQRDEDDVPTVPATLGEELLYNPFRRVA